MIVRVDVSVAIEKRRQDFGAGNNVTTAFKYSWLETKRKNETVNKVIYLSLTEVACTFANSPARFQAFHSRRATFRLQHMTHELGDALRAVGGEEVLEVLILDVRQIPLLLGIGEIVRENSLTLKKTSLAELWWDWNENYLREAATLIGSDYHLRNSAVDDSTSELGSMEASARP